ncbi:MAG: redoxin family protein [Azospirillum sp.]|nr:redoxin family protein [Azospirillum sp.]
MTVNTRTRTALAMAAALLIGFGASLPAAVADRTPPDLAGSIGKYLPIDPAVPAPDFAFLDRDGGRMALKDFAGKVLLVNLWATWCGPCVKEMPALDRLEAALGGGDFAVVAVSLDRGGAAVVEPFFKKAGIKALTMYFDPSSQAMTSFRLRGLPTSLVIDRDGNQVGRLEGDADWDSGDAQRLIRYYIGMPSGPHGRGGGVIRTGG